MHSFMSTERAGGPGVVGTGSYLPESVLSNDELAVRLGIDPEWIEERTGVRERRVADPSEATSDLATEAARRALLDAGLSADGLDLIVLATSTPDRPIPATACQVQANLGARGAFAMDVDAACTGFVCALEVAHKMMVGNPRLGNTVVIGADTYSRVLDYQDRRTCVLFGDGAGAVVLARSANAAEITYTRFGSDGEKGDYAHVPAGGSRQPVTADALAQRSQFFKMQGRNVRDYAFQVLPAMVRDVAERCALAISEFDVLVPHQANVRILEQAAKEIGLLPHQLGITGDRYGNTGAASVAVTLDEVVRDGRIGPGGRVLLAAFGGGMTWGSALLRWPGGEHRPITDEVAGHPV
ncbi:beta-ketoacyl-ACP synthase III [Micromonospora echinospora]